MYILHSLIHHTAAKHSFSVIGIDLQCGFPTTSEGYKGVLVIVEYLSKYPWAVPIKSKSAKEIASKLLVYFSIFGPADEICSDLGTEFNNEIVDELIKGVGMEHRVTSAYHPRTNGLVERFNSTLSDSLAKHASENKLDWPKWLPWVLLLFGRKMNTFRAWTNKSDGNTVDAVYNRSIELRKLVEVDQLKKAQLEQLKTQNKAHKITEDILPVGTKVYVEVKGIHDKLYPKYRGPFTILEYTLIRFKGLKLWVSTTKKRMKENFLL